jgi:hypothetical protein
MHSNALRLTLFLAAVPGIAACGDDNPGTPDARVDAPRQIDATPDGPTFKEFDADEGGEVRLEYVRFPSAPTAYAALRATAFFYKDAGPTEFHPFPNLNGCTDMTGATNWPIASAPAAEKTYADPGSVIISGGPMVFEIPKAAGTADFLSRPHKTNEWRFRFGGTPGGANDGGTFLSDKTTYDVTLTGSADIEPTVFADVGYMPADYAITSHNTFPMTLDATADQTFTWSLPADTPPAGFTVNSLVAITAPSGGPAFLCIEPQNDGSITVPAAMLAVAKAKYPTGTAGMALARQTLTHVVHELMDGEGNPTGKRIDFLTVWCYANGFTWAP